MQSDPPAVNTDRADFAEWPSRYDATISRASAAIGGPKGRFASARNGWWTPLRILLAIAAFTLVLGYMQKEPCANGRWISDSQYTQVCYSDVIPLWGAEGLSSGAVPYRDHAVEYPVVTGAFMWVTAELTRAWHAAGLPGSDEGVVFGVLTCVLLAICGLLAVAATAGAAGERRRWDAAIFAASPLLVFHAYTNWDLLAMAFMSGALWAWSVRRPVATGVFIGLGTAAKLYPVLFIVVLLFLAYRTKVWRPVVWVIVSAVATWLAVNLPVAIAWTRGWWEFYSFSSSRPAEASTFWAMLNNYFPHVFSTPSTGGWRPPGLVVGVVLLLALALVGWLTLRAAQQPRLAQVTFLVVAAFLLTTKVWSPQYSLWLVPLLALARPRWRMALLWQATEIGVWIATLLWLLADHDSNHALTYDGLVWFLLVRDAVLLTLMGMIVYEMWHPEFDVVRAPGDPDPGGGFFVRSRVRGGDGFGDPADEPEQAPAGGSATVGAGAFIEGFD